MIEIVHDDGYNNVTHIISERRETTMSSVITFYTPKYAVIGSDGRSINIETGKIKTDEKTKIVKYENSLIGITGRTDFYFNNKKMEVEDILSVPNSLSSFLNEAHLQSRTQDNTYLTILTPRHITYDNKDEKYIQLTLVTIGSGKIVVESGENDVCVYSGVQHCKKGYAQRLSFTENKFIENVLKCINYDEEVENEIGRKGVGGRKEVYEVYADGRIHKCGGV